MENYTYDYFLEKIKTLEECIEKYEEESVEYWALQKDLSNANNLRLELLNKYAGKFGYISTVENKHYSKEELEELRAELDDTSIFTLLKRFFGIGKKNDELYAELMGKTMGLIKYLEEESVLHKSALTDAESILTNVAGAYKSDYQKIRSVSGCTTGSDWGRYKETEEFSGSLYFGDIDSPLECTVQFSEDILQEIMQETYENHHIKIPYTRSLEEPIHFLYNYKKQQHSYSVQAVRSIIYQMIRMTPSYFMEMHLMDGENTGSDFGELIELQKVREGDLIYLNKRVTGSSYKMAKTYFSDQEITDGLRNLDRYMTLVAEEIGSYGSLKVYNDANSKKNGKGIIPYQVVLIQNFPTGFTDEDIKLLDKLIRNGRNRGISLIIMNNLDRWTEILSKTRYTQDKAKSIEEKLSIDTVNNLDTFNLKPGTTLLNATDCSSPCRLHLLRNINPGYIQSVITVKMEVNETDNYFPHVFDEETPYGSMNATEGLRIPFALDRKGHLMEYSLGEAMNAHGLISGGTGSGKSTLLHMLISSIVMNYTPDDVEIWLADYKITEFASYKANTPPHIGFIGLSKTPDFSYAFIDKITNEMTRRQNVIAEADYQMKKAGENINITNFKQYRESFPTKPMKRLIVIIDEFHVMAQHAQQESEYKEKLENLLAEARALGIILLFSDQAIVDGLNGLSDKGKKQIKARIAMSNYEDELKETLNIKEYDKIKPFLNMNTGEIAVQSVTKERDEEGILKDVVHIERGLVIYIDGEWRSKVSTRVRELYGAENYIPDIFDDRIEESADWSAIEQWEKEYLKPHRNGDKDMQIYIGRPVSLEFSMHFPLLQRKGNNIMSCSGSEEQQYKVLESIIYSFSRQENCEILVFADPFASVYREYCSELEYLASSMRNMSIYDELEDICYHLNRLLGIMNDRGNRTRTLIIWLGLDSMADLLKEEPLRKPESLAKLVKKDEGGRKTQSQKEENNGLNTVQNDLESQFAFLFGDDFFKTDEEVAEELEKEEADETDEEEQESYLYNACDDIAKIIHLGPTRNLYNMVIYDSAAALKDFREVKIADFNHKIAFSMSENEASDFIERAALIRGLPEHMAFYYNGRSGKRFIPYKL